MSGELSPMPMSDDSALGSAVSSLVNHASLRTYSVIERQQSCSSSSSSIKNSTLQNATRPPANISAGSPKFVNTEHRNAVHMVQQEGFGTTNDSNELELAALSMRSNVGLISKSIRTVLSCFDDLDVQRFELRTDLLINFISNGINKCNTSVLRPMSILWPNTYEDMCRQLSVLDSFLITTQFRDNPVDWMLRRGLTVVPDCKSCNKKMSVRHEGNTVSWQCTQQTNCFNYIIPIQRPSFFRNHENIGLDKLLFSIYHWSICTPCEEVCNLMNLEPEVLISIWKRMQNICRTALEKTYPRHRLTNLLESTNSITIPESEAIDLVSIKVNDVFVVCAKHPASNLVRIGLHIPNVSQYSFVDLTESWFAHGTYIRVAEPKFLGLAKKRTDLKIELVDRKDIISKNGSFNRESAFGYIICQLTHVLKDYDSSSMSRESLKLILAELQWREMFGTNPFDALTNIVNHISQYGSTSDWYSEPSLPVDGEETIDKGEGQLALSLNSQEYSWAERYFYATVDPVDSSGNLISKQLMERQMTDDAPIADVRIRCHDCRLRFECFEFSLHMICHVEHNRNEATKKSSTPRSVIECKHCFKEFKREQITSHSLLFRAHWHLMQFGCRICCELLPNRSAFLQHMRQLHFEHETPYRCPSCSFASSMQRDVLIHFQEDHRHSMIILCPLCLRSFTVAKPETMTYDTMNELSKIVYEHICQHYIIGKSFACSNCCLCFVDKETLMSHKQLHHNPLEIRPIANTKLQPFIVTAKEEKYCTRALPVELFISNKRPNLTQANNDQHCESSHQLQKQGRGVKKKTTLSQGKRKATSQGNWRGRVSKSRDDENSDDHDKYCSKYDSDNSDQEMPSKDNDIEDEEVNDKYPNNEQIGPRSNPTALLQSVDNDDDYDDESLDDDDETTIHVRGLRKINKFLAGGRPALLVHKSAAAANTSASKTSQQNPRLSEILIECLSKMKRIDGILPNQSVILTPEGRPAKCCECFEYIANDHFVALINCKSCGYVTNCPRSATKHKTLSGHD